MSATQLSTIIPGKIYLGSSQDARDLETLTRLGVTHILNVTPDIPCHHERQFSYLRIAQEDGVERFQEQFESAFSYIEKANVVFVHCRHGISRSPTIVISYLMKKNRWNFDNAYRLVKKMRPIVNPHFYFWVALNLFQEKLKQKG